MHQVQDGELEAMSVRELLALQAAVETAIRAAIRKKNEERVALYRPATATTAAAPEPIDIERERDRWLAARQRGQG